MFEIILIVKFNMHKINNIWCTTLKIIENWLKMTQNSII